MRVQDIVHHLAATVGTELSREKIVDEDLRRGSRLAAPAVQGVLFSDLPRRSRCKGPRRRARAQRGRAHLAVGVDMDGIKHVLGIWIQQSEGAKFGASVCAELANRGVRDVLIVYSDGLTGLPQAIEATWPDSIVQTCVVHLIRNAIRLVAYGQRKAVTGALKPVSQAPTADSARTALDAFATSELGRANPHAAAVFESAWERFTPFLAFPPEVRRVIYTTNAIESLNIQLRKVTKNRGHFPNDAAVIKLLWLAICDIEDKRARDQGRPPPNDEPRDASSKDKSSPTGEKPSNNSPSHSPNESAATSKPRGPRTYTHNLTGSLVVLSNTYLASVERRNRPPEFIRFNCDGRQGCPVTRRLRAPRGFCGATDCSLARRLNCIRSSPTGGRFSLPPLIPSQPCLCRNSRDTLGMAYLPVILTGMHLGTSRLVDS